MTCEICGQDEAFCAKEEGSHGAADCYQRGYEREKARADGLAIELGATVSTSEGIRQWGHGQKARADDLENALAQRRQVFCDGPLHRVGDDGPQEPKKETK